MADTDPILKHPKHNVAVIVLAAGLGTRMKSQKAKVLHELMGRPMISYVVETAKKVTGNNIILVIGHQAEKVQEVVSAGGDVTCALQKKQLGTGHAVQTALPYLKNHINEVVILCGDVPLLTAETILRLVGDHVAAQRDITVLAVDIENPKGYGRLLLDENKNILKIIEEVDATAAQKQIKTINAGIYCVKKETLVDAVQKIGSANAKGERYFTDIIEIGNRQGKSVGVIFSKDSEEVIGINTLQDLITAERILGNRFAKIS